MEIHGVIFQKTIIFIVATLMISNLLCLFFLILSNVLPGSIAWLIVSGLRCYYEILSCGII